MADGLKDGPVAKEMATDNLVTEAESEEYPYETDGDASAAAGYVWQPCVDETTGYTYYWNSLTNEVVWEPPADYSSLLQPPPPPPPPLPTGPDPAQLAKEGIQLITSYGGDSTDSESEEDTPVRSKRRAPARASAKARSPSPAAEYGPSLPSPAAESGPSPSSHVTEYGPSLPSPAAEYGPSLPSPAAEYGPSLPSPAAEYGPSLPSHATEYGPSLPSPENDSGPSMPSPSAECGPQPPPPDPDEDESSSQPATAPLSMGPFGTTSAGFIGPVIPSEVSSPALTADREDTEGTMDSDEEALLTQLRERAAQLKQLGGELPTAVKATIEAVAGVETEEVSEESEATASAQPRKKRRVKRSLSPPGEEGGPTAKGSRRQKRLPVDSDEQDVDPSEDTSAADPMMDIISAIENERPPDYDPDDPTPASPEHEAMSNAHDESSKTSDAKSSSPTPEAVSTDNDPTCDLLSEIENEVPPDYQENIAESGLGSASVRRRSDHEPTKDKQAEEPNKSRADTTIDIFSEIEQEVPPDYEVSSPKSETGEVPMEIAAEDEQSADSGVEARPQDNAKSGQDAVPRKYTEHEKYVSSPKKESNARSPSPMDIISEIENEQPPDYVEQGSQASREDSHNTAGGSRLDNSLSKTSSKSEILAKESTEAKPAVRAAAVDQKRTVQRIDTEVASLSKPARRRSRSSIQGMGLIAAYGSDYSESESEDAEVSDSAKRPRSSEVSTDSAKRSQPRGKTTTPPLASEAPPSPTAGSGRTSKKQTPNGNGVAEPSAPSDVVTTSKFRPKRQQVHEADSPPHTELAAAPSYTTFSADSYEAPVVAAQDGTRIGLGFHGDAKPERMAWESSSETDGRGKPASSSESKRLKFVQFHKGATLEPSPVPPAISSSGVVTSSGDEKTSAQNQENNSQQVPLPYDISDDEALIHDLVTEIVDKLEYLGVASETASALKVFAVQTQTLLDAWTEGSLQPAYFLRWLSRETVAFAARERESAPPSWTMQWNRREKRYIYTHQKSGRVSYVFPETSEDTDGPSQYRAASPCGPAEFTPEATAAPESEPVTCESTPPASRKYVPRASAKAALTQPTLKASAPPPAPTNPVPASKPVGPALAPKPANHSAVPRPISPPPSEAPPAVAEPTTLPTPPPPPPSLPPAPPKLAAPPPPTLRPSKRRVPPPPVLSAYEPPPPGEELPPPGDSESESPQPPPPPQISAQEAPPPPPPPPPPTLSSPPPGAEKLLSELDSFYSEVGLLDEMSKPPVKEVEAAAPCSPTPPPPAAVKDAAAHPHAKKKKKTKLNSALVHKKKDVDKLVAKWQTVQKQLR